MGFLWRMKGFLAFVVLGLGVTGGVMYAMNRSKNVEASMVAPEVPGSSRIQEQESRKGTGKGQNTGLTLVRDAWIQVSGTFQDSKDTDRYLFQVGPGVNAYEVQTWIKKEGKLAAHTGLLGVNRFPMTIVKYDKKGNVITNQLLAASGGGAALEEGTASISLNISGAEPDPEEVIRYTDGNPYTIYLRGVYKEPKAVKTAQTSP